MRQSKKKNPTKLVKAASCCLLSPLTTTTGRILKGTNVLWRFSPKRERGDTNVLWRLTSAQDYLSYAFSKSHMNAEYVRDICYNT